MFYGSRIDTTPEVTCKIHCIKNIYFSNIHSLADHSFLIAKKVCEDQIGVKNVITVFEKEFIRQTLPILEKYKIQNPSYYESLINDSILCQTIFFGFEESLPYMISVLFRARQLLTGQINLKAEAHDGILFIGGEVREIDTLFSNEALWNQGPVSAIDKLIGIEINSHPKEVSYPIDIIKLTKSEKIWIRRKQMCE